MDVEKKILGFGAPPFIRVKDGHLSLRSLDSPSYVSPIDIRSLNSFDLSPIPPHLTEVGATDSVEFARLHKQTNGSMSVKYSCQLILQNEQNGVTIPYEEHSYVKNPFVITGVHKVEIMEHPNSDDNHILVQVSFNILDSVKFTEVVHELSDDMIRLNNPIYSKVVIMVPIHFRGTIMVHGVRQKLDIVNVNKPFLNIYYTTAPDCQSVAIEKSRIRTLAGYSTCNTRVNKSTFEDFYLQVLGVVDEVHLNLIRGLAQETSMFTFCAYHHINNLIIYDLTRWRSVDIESRQAVALTECQSVDNVSLRSLDSTVQLHKSNLRGNLALKSAFGIEVIDTNVSGSSTTMKSGGNIDIRNSKFQWAYVETHSGVFIVNGCEFKEGQFLAKEYFDTYGGTLVNIQELLLPAIEGYETGSCFMGRFHL